jgi:hypothetical protein
LVRVLNLNYIMCVWCDIFLFEMEKCPGSLSSLCIRIIFKNLDQYLDFSVIVLISVTFLFFLAIQEATRTFSWFLPANVGSMFNGWAKFFSS